ncbi:unnamed protein product, partial [Discosporangium mesarthrocarpum]
HGPHLSWTSPQSVAKDPRISANKRRMRKPKLSVQWEPIWRDADHEKESTLLPREKATFHPLEVVKVKGSATLGLGIRSPIDSGRKARYLQGDTISELEMEEPVEYGAMGARSAGNGRRFHNITSQAKVVAPGLSDDPLSLIVEQNVVASNLSRQGVFHEDDDDLSLPRARSGT